MEAFLRALMPRLLPPDRTFEVHPFQGKPDLLRRLESRLRGYAKWLPSDWRIVVVVDRDDDDCAALKQQMEDTAAAAGLRTRSRTSRRAFQLINRIAIEELEAWYFGDWGAVVSAYPRVGATVPHRRGFRDPDMIVGGTWERFEQVLQSYGYFQTGLLKIDAARVLGALVDPSRSRSRSFGAFCHSIATAAA